MRRGRTWKPLWRARIRGKRSCLQMDEEGGGEGGGVGDREKREK